MSGQNQRTVVEADAGPQMAYDQNRTSRHETLILVSNRERPSRYQLRSSSQAWTRAINWEREPTPNFLNKPLTNPLMVDSTR